MLRVLQVIGKMDRAGAETMIMNLYRHVDKSKVQFDFMVFTDEEGDYDQEIKEMGGNIYHMPAFKGYNYFSLYKKFGEFFKEHPYDVVHGHIGSLAPAYLKCAKKAGAFTIAHSHCAYSNNLIERFVFSLFAHSVRYIADFFFACAQEAGRDRFGARIVKSNNFKVINNAIDCKAFTYSENRHMELKRQFGYENKVVLGHVGRFAAQKNHSFLIDIFKEICEESEEYVLLLLGVGEEKETIENKVKEYGLSDKVCFMGIRGDIPDMMNLFDAFVFPSFYEGLAVVSVEAQASGLPCFFSDTITKECIVTPNVWQYPLEIGAKGWKDNILRELKDYERKDTYQYIADAGFDVAYSARELEEFYLEHSKQGSC